MLSGMKIYENIHLVVTVKRSFKERFFTRPWQPWVSTKSIPNPNFVKVQNNFGEWVFVGHPVVVRALKEKLF